MFIFRIILLIYTILNLLVLFLGEVNKKTMVAVLYFIAVIISLVF